MPSQFLLPPFLLGHEGAESQYKWGGVTIQKGAWLPSALGNRIPPFLNAKQEIELNLYLEKPPQFFQLPN